jgi:hypothetical protein
MFSNTFAQTNLYASPNESSDIIAEVLPEHELEMQSSDWVKVFNKTTNTEGWAKLSELREKLNNGGYWEFSYQSDQDSGQKISYKPISENEYKEHVLEMRKSHETMVKKFEKVWLHTKHASEVTENK